MKAEVSLRNLEKKTASLIFTTGLVDIEIALIWIVSSLAMLFDDYRYYIYVLFLVPVAFILLSVRYIVHPRLGKVNFTQNRVKRNRSFYIITTLILVVLVLFTAFGKSDFLSNIINPGYIVAGIMFTICAAIAYFLNFRRMYFYAFLITAGFLVSEHLRSSLVEFKSGYVYLIVASIILIIGCLYLFRFLKKYPLENSIYHA